MIRTHGLALPTQKPNFFQERCNLGDAADDSIRKICRHVDFKTLLNMCQTSKYLYKTVTNVHYTVTSKDQELFKRQAIRLLYVRNKHLHRDQSTSYYEHIIFEDSYGFLDEDTAKPMRYIQYVNFSSHINTEIGPKVILISKDGTESSIEISDNCKRSIKALAENKRPKMYSCVDFAKESLGRYTESKLNECCPMDNPLNVLIGITEKDLSSRDVIALHDYKTFKHFAIYMTNGIYLSKHGLGPLLYTNLEDMQTAWDAKEYCKVL